jgi:hypothetical protein
LSFTRHRKVSSTTCLLAFALLTALPAEHLHEADTAGAAVVHRHLDDTETPSQPDGPTEHHDRDDHATVRSLSPVFQTSPKFAPSAPAVLTVSAVAVQGRIFLSHVVSYDAVPVHSPPTRLLASRAPPARA